MPALRSVGGVDVLFDEAGAGSSAKLLIVGTGACAPDAIEAARRLAADGLAVTVVDPCWLLPISSDLADMTDGYDAVLTVEDGIVRGGFGWALRDALAEAGTPVHCLGAPQNFPEHGDRAQMIADFGYDADGIEASARALVNAVSAR